MKGKFEGYEFRITTDYPDGIFVNWFGKQKSDSYITNVLIADVSMFPMPHFIIPNMMYDIYCDIEYVDRVDNRITDDNESASGGWAVYMKIVKVHHVELNMK